MGNQGRFGKYGDNKRRERLRNSGLRDSLKGREDKPKERINWGKRISPLKRMSIRKAKPSDERFVSRLSGKVFDIYGPYEEMVSRWFLSGVALVLIAREEGKSIGFAMIGPVTYKGEEHVSELLAIAVDPERQQRGIGSRLLQEMERHAAFLGEKKIFLHTAQENLAAQKLFIRAGYHLCTMERAFYPAGQDALMMVKELETGF